VKGKIMAKKPTEKQPKEYPGSERFGDWSMDNIIPMEPGDVLVNDDPEGDPNKIAYHGTGRKHPYAKFQK
jgi:hypothetical protein